MQMYRWLSEYLKNYGYGHIVVCANSVEEARALARAGYEKHSRERYDYHYFDDAPLDEDSQETLDEHRRKFEADIAAEPEICPNYLFIAGSE